MRMESYIVQLDFSAAFDRLSHSGIIFKFKSIGVGGNVLSVTATLLAVVRKPADTPAVAASLNMDLASIHEWCNPWCMILNDDKTMALVVSIDPGL